MENVKSLWDLPISRVDPSYKPTEKPARAVIYNEEFYLLSAPFRAEICAKNFILFCGYCGEDVARLRFHPDPQVWHASRQVCAKCAAAGKQGYSSFDLHFKSWEQVPFEFLIAEFLINTQSTRV